MVAELIGQAESLEWAAKAGPWGLIVLIVSALLYVIIPRLLDFHFNTTTKELADIKKLIERQHKTSQGSRRMIKHILRNQGKPEDVEEDEE